MSECEVCRRAASYPIKVHYKDEVHQFCCLDCLVSHYQPRGERERSTDVVKHQRVNVISEIEEERGTKLIAMIHRQEGKEGKRRYITIEDSEEILREIRLTNINESIDFVVHCPGGLILPAEQIAMAVRDHSSKVTVIVPHYAMSGGTLIALAADEILMDAHSVLGPLDPQIQGIPAPSLIKVLETKPIEYISDNVLIAADVAAKALNQMRLFIERLLKDKMDGSRARMVAEFLTGGYLTHDTPITAEAAQALGLPVKLGIPERIYELLRLYDFGKPIRPSLFQIPCPCLSKQEQ
ncbi:MAG: hypothetical protein ACE5GD_10615 [Candidatus Geothermarchaeales archaeon]